MKSLHLLLVLLSLISCISCSQLSEPNTETEKEIKLSTPEGASKLLWPVLTRKKFHWQNGPWLAGGWAISYVASVFVLGLSSKAFFDFNDCSSDCLGLNTGIVTAIEAIAWIGLATESVGALVTMINTKPYGIINNVFISLLVSVIKGGLLVFAKGYLIQGEVIGLVTLLAASAIEVGLPLVIVFAFAAISFCLMPLQTTVTDEL